VKLGRCVLVAAMALLPAGAHAQLQAKRLIIHADDIGMAESVNRAAFALIERGTVTSVSVMAPGPAFESAVTWLRAHPAVDVGVHLTLTSEWSGVRWRPVLPADSVRTLIEADGTFKRRWEPATVDPREVEKELRAQIALVKRSGLAITHLDVHQYVLYETARIYSEMLARLANDFDVPVLLARTGLPGSGQVATTVRDPIVIDALQSIGPGTLPSQWAHYYDGIVRTLPLGVTELIVHPGFDDAELRTMTAGIEAWGAAWRQREYDLLMSDTFRKLLEDRAVLLSNWRTVHRYDTGAGRRP
jgi:predicted glycoside hydrolase/deacetylase ChbG (UPF0249 family)